MWIDFFDFKVQDSKFTIDYCTQCQVYSPITINSLLSCNDHGSLKIEKGVPSLQETHSFLIKYLEKLLLKILVGIVEFFLRFFGFFI